MHSISLGPFGLAIDYALVWGGFILALVALRWFSKDKAQRESADNSLFLIFFVGLVAARLAFVIRMWPQYQQNLFAMLDIRDGGFHAASGVMVGVGVLLYRLKAFPDTRPALVKTLLLTVCIVLPLYVGINLYNRAEQMPVPTLTSVTGKPVSLADFQDKPVIINFWATWCPPCRREMPVLQKAQQRYSDFHFVFVNQSEPGGVVRDFLSEQQLQLNNVLLDINGSVSEQFGVAVLPTTLFYSPQGTLLYRHVGGVSEASLDYALQQMKAQHAETTR